jgi:hypothetical protein
MLTLTPSQWALQYAVATEDLEPCKIMIAAGADLDIEDDYGMCVSVIPTYVAPC